jgi:hypothetical protein
VDEIDDSTFIFVTLSTSHSDWAEAFPEESFADVGGDEQRDTTTDSVAFLEHFIEHNDNNSSEGELNNNKKSVSSSDIF